MRYIAITGVALFSLLLGTIVGYYTNIEVPEIVIHWPDRKANEYSPSYNGETGDEVAFIFIGSSKCQYANDERVNRIVRRAKLHLSRLINEKGLGFSATGIAKDWIVRDGIEYLGKFGSFDEILAGRSWLNEGVLKYVYEEIPGYAATPQIIVTKRKVLGVDHDYYGTIGERILTRKIGIQELLNWEKNGFPIPVVSSQSMVR